MGEVGFSGIKIKSFLLALTVTVGGCAEQFIEDPAASNQSLPVTQSPTPAISDGFLGVASIVFRRSVRLTWNSTSGISNWCVSESQTQPPILACSGGQGPDGGWSATPPDTFLLSPGAGSKVLFTWVRDLEGNLLPLPNVTAVAHYCASMLIPFNNGSGNLITALNGTGFFFSLGSAGRWVNDRSIELDGISSYVDLGTPSELRFRSSFTVMGWVKSAQPGGQMLIARYDPASTDRAYNLHFTSSSLQFEVSKDGSTVSGMWGRASADYVGRQFQNQWRHFAGVYEAKTDGTSRVTLYIDGVKVDETNTGPASILDPSGLKVALGTASDLASYPLKGQLGAMAFFPTALSQAVVQATFVLQKPGY